MNRSILSKRELIISICLDVASVRISSGHVVKFAKMAALAGGGN